MPEVDWSRFVDDANRQHSGGNSFNKGAIFQQYGETHELLRVASNFSENGVGGDALFVSEVKRSRVDDLHVIWRDPNYAWRIQFKAVAKRKWTLKLETQFRQEHYYYPHSPLFLVVHTSELAQEMRDSREDIGLGFVTVDHLDIDHVDNPHTAVENQVLLDKLILGRVPAAHYLATWTAVFGTWARLRRGHFSELWTDICNVSKHVLKPLQQASAEAISRANLLTSKTSLSVAAQGEIVILTNDVLYATALLPWRMSLENDDFWLPMPQNAWELIEKLGACEL